VTAMTERVLAVEAAYAAVGTRRPIVAAEASDRSEPLARAIASAVASRYLAVGTPRSIGLVFDVGPEIDEAILALEAHRTWFAPTDIRCARSVPGAEELADRIAGRAVTVAEALAADIVCVIGCYAPVPAAAIRRGTHINVHGPRWCIQPDLLEIAVAFDEAEGLPKLAAGLVDGRQLDEITVFFGDGASTALAAL